MSSSGKMKQKEKQKSKIAKKKQQQNVLKKQESKKVRKISEKYLKEDIQVENSLKERNLTDDDDYTKQKQDEIDFFCDPFSSVPLNVEKFHKTGDTDEENGSEKDDEELSRKSEDQQSNNSSPNTHMASTYIGQDYDTVVEKFELTRISYDELELLYYPKVRNLTQTKVKDEENNLRNKEDEGLFLADPPKISKMSNKLLLLERLNESNAADLLTENGDLKNFHEILGDEMYRLRCDKEFTPIYVPPQPMTFEPLDKILTERKFLKIFIANLNFDQHKLFTNEHHAARMVEKLFSEYERRQKFDIAETLRNKLKKLREAKEENITKSKNEEVSLTQQIKKVRLKLHVEEQYDYKILKSLLENWKNLKTIRKNQNFALTNVVLKIQKKDIEVEELQNERQQRYDAELNEMINEEFEKYYAAKQVYKQHVKSINDPENISNEQEVLKKPKKPDIDKIVGELNEIYDKLPTDDPKVEIFMSYENQEKPIDKIKRFTRVTYRIELEVDGEIVGSTKNFKLNEDFCISIQSAFILKLTKHLPEKLKLIVSI